MERRLHRRRSRVDHARCRAVPRVPYQAQAAIAAIHDEAPNPEETDWPQIKALYELLRRSQTTQWLR